MKLIWQGFLEAIELIVRLDPLVMESAWLSIWVSTLAVFLASIAGLPLGILLARKSFPLRGVVVSMVRAMMALPTVFVGVACFAIFSKAGILGSLHILYTPWAIVAGEFFLALPIITSLTHGAVSTLDARAGETAWTLGAGPFRRMVVYLREVNMSVRLAVLTAFARCVTELGIAMIVGGNIKHQTRTLSTATAIEVSQGEFSRALAMGMILVVIAMGVTIIIGFLGGDSGRVVANGSRVESRAQGRQP